MSIRSLLGLLAILFLMGSTWGILSYQHFLKTEIIDISDYQFRLNKGKGALHVIQTLVSENKMEQSIYPRIFLYLNPEFKQLKQGLYAIEKGATIQRIFETLKAGQQIQFSVTFVEGWTFQQMMQQIRRHPQIQQTTLTRTDNEILALVSNLFTHPEGLFYPDTYHFPEGYTDIALLKQAHTQLLKVLNREWESRASDLPYQSPYEALIMASIIEKETGLAEERPKIAGVFVRRLQKRMRLQTDPTVIYGVGEAFDGNLTKRHLKTDTPYNSYTRRGLPPTPIALVNRAAIYAALNPESGSELYFVAKGDGSHQFSDTLEQHLKAVRTYQLKR